MNRSHEQNGPPTIYKNANGTGVKVEETRIAVVMVGLPARGKSLIAQKGPSIHFPLDKTRTLTRTLSSGPLPCLALHTCQMLQRWLLPPK